MSSFVHDEHVQPRIAASQAVNGLARVDEAAGVSGSFVLNFFSATFSSDTISGFVGPYRDEHAFRQLVAAQDGWTAWRDVDDGARVYVWGHHSGVEFRQPGFRAVHVELFESTPLFCRVLLSGVDRHLHTRGFARIGRNGYVNWGTGNLLSGLDVRGFIPDARIGIFPKILIDSFVTRFRDGAPLVGVTVDIAYTTRIDVPVDEMLTTKYDVRGRYVKLRPGSKFAPAFEGRAIGRVIGIEGEQLVLDDVHDRQFERVNASMCLLEPGRQTLDGFIRHCYPSYYQAVRTMLRDKLNRFNAPASKLHLIEEFVRKRLVNPDDGVLQIAAGMAVTFAPATSPAVGADAFPARELHAPVYSFDPESPKTHGAPDAGLRLYGPYSRARLYGTVLRVLVLAPEGFKGHVEQFVGQFQVGIRGYERAYNGFQRKYRLDKVDVTEHYFSWSGGPAKDAYYNATVEALEEATDYDVCFVVIRDDFKQLAPADNPYYVCKALLLSFGITVQDVRIETLRMPEQSFQWTLNTLALATYAKLGGTPFVLKARQLRHHELVIGIGRSIERPAGTRLAVGKQVIGFTAIFRSDGDYLLSACTPYADVTDYQRRLEDVVLKAVTEVAATEGIADGETIRLIFHVYKRTGRREVQAIQNAIAKLTRYHIEFGLLHINDTHGFKLFDRTNPGIRDRSGRLNQATSFIAPRQLMVELGPRERLVNLIGPQQYRQRGTPTPLRLTLDRASTFRDLDYLTQQAYEFSFMSWRSFNPGTQPVTVYYSELMAGLNSRLRQLAPWNQELVRTKLSRKLWFI